MNVNSQIKKYVQENNKWGLISTICTLIGIDRDFSKGKVNDNLQYIESELGNIYEEFDGENLLSGKENLTQDDFSKALFRLEKNFCKERLKDVEKIGIKLYGDKDPTKSSDNKTNNNQKKPQAPQEIVKEKSAVPVIVGGIGIAIIIIGVIVLKKIRG